MDGLSVLLGKEALHINPNNASDVVETLKQLRDELNGVMVRLQQLEELSRTTTTPSTASEPMEVPHGNDTVTTATASKPAVDDEQPPAVAQLLARFALHTPEEGQTEAGFVTEELSKEGIPLTEWYVVLRWLIESGRMTADRIADWPSYGDIMATPLEMAAEATMNQDDV